MALSAPAQVKTEVPPVAPGAKPVAVEHIKIHGAALEGNLEGDAVDREALVFLPPSYATDNTRRYPVVYALHGYSIGAVQWSQEIHVPQTIEGAFAQGAQEMIVVLPDSKTVHNGSMYSSSVTTGDFEQYIARDVVAWSGGPFHGRLRRKPHWHEASGSVRSVVYHEPLLHVRAAAPVRSIRKLRKRWSGPQLRDLFRHPYQRGCGPLPELCDAVFRQESLQDGQLQIEPERAVPPKAPNA